MDSSEDSTGSINEHFDEDGNVLSVGDLTFVEGILGTGSYGTVRLARRPATPQGWPSKAPSHDNSSAGSSNVNQKFPPQSTKKPPEPRNLEDRRASFTRSCSAPGSGSDFFSLQSSEELEESRHSHVKSSNPIGSLGLIVRSSLQAVSSIGLERQSVTDEFVAVKILEKSILKRARTMERDASSRKVKIRTALEQVEQEIALMKKMSHPNLVQLYEVIDSPESDTLYMVIEYMPLGEILTYRDDGTFRRKAPKDGGKQMDGVVDGHFDEAQAALFFVDILHGLAYLHQNHVIHRDLKPENILLDSRCIARISDFGVSHFFREEGEFTTQEGPHNRLTRHDTDSALRLPTMASNGFLSKTEGTWCFWSPEMCDGSNSTFSGYAADIWAAGICLYIFVTGKLPFYSENPTELFDLIAEADVCYAGLGLSNSLLDILRSTLEKNPRLRAGVGDCLQHPFLSLAREKRIRQLSVEFERSRLRNLIVSDEDIRKALHIVNPVVLLRTAHSKLRGGLQAARDRFAVGPRPASSDSVVGQDGEGTKHSRRFAAPFAAALSLSARTPSKGSDLSDQPRQRRGIGSRGPSNDSLDDNSSSMSTPVRDRKQRRGLGSRSSSKESIRSDDLERKMPSDSKQHIGVSGSFSRDSLDPETGSETQQADAAAVAARTIAEQPDLAAAQSSSTNVSNASQPAAGRRTKPRLDKKGSALTHTTSNVSEDTEGEVQKTLMTIAQGETLAGREDALGDKQQNAPKDTDGILPPKPKKELPGAFKAGKRARKRWRRRFSLRRCVIQ